MINISSLFATSLPAMEINQQISVDPSMGSLYKKFEYWLYSAHPVYPTILAYLTAYDPCAPKLCTNEAYAATLPKRVNHVLTSSNPSWFAAAVQLNSRLLQTKLDCNMDNHKFIFSK